MYSYAAISVHINWIKFCCKEAKSHLVLCAHLQSLIYLFHLWLFPSTMIRREKILKELFSMQSFSCNRWFTPKSCDVRWKAQLKLRTCYFSLVIPVHHSHLQFTSDGVQKKKKNTSTACPIHGWVSYNVVNVFITNICCHDVGIGFFFRSLLISSLVSALDLLPRLACITRQKL